MKRRKEGKKRKRETSKKQDETEKARKREEKRKETEKDTMFSFSFTKLEEALTDRRTIFCNFQQLI